jgi:hypothetical protein
MYNFWKKDWKIYINFQQSGNEQSGNGKEYIFLKAGMGKDIHFMEARMDSLMYIS